MWALRVQSILENWGSPPSARAHYGLVCAHVSSERVLLHTYTHTDTHAHTHAYTHTHIHTHPDCTPVELVVLELPCEAGSYDVIAPGLFVA